MLLTLCFILGVLGGAYYYIFYPYQKIKRMKRGFVIKVSGAEERYPDLPLGNIGIFSSADRNHRIQAIFPMLTPRSKVEYIYSWHDIHAVHVPPLDSMSSQDKINLSAAQELSALVRDHVRFVEPEIIGLRQQKHKINGLLNLVATSEVYRGHQEIYERALLQVEDLIDKAEELQLVYVRAIREILIGRQVASYDPNALPDNRFVIDHKHRKVRAEYQNMKDVAMAHAELLRTRQI
ncbi:MAG: hypothetical protein ACFB5Z_14270 [Elainellaceae cyanobacterium]